MSEGPKKKFQPKIGKKKNRYKKGKHAPKIKESFNPAEMGVAFSKRRVMKNQNVRM